MDMMQRIAAIGSNVANTINKFIPLIKNNSGKVIIEKSFNRMHFLNDFFVNLSEKLVHN